MNALRAIRHAIYDWYWNKYVHTGDMLRVMRRSWRESRNREVIHRHQALRINKSSHI